jgi:hypothetical protein
MPERRHARIQASRDQINDCHKVRAMLSPNFPDNDDIVSPIFEDILTGALKREDVRAPHPDYIAAHNRPRYAKFGDSLLLSVDEGPVRGRIDNPGRHSQPRLSIFRTWVSNGWVRFRVGLFGMTGMVPRWRRKSRKPSLS